MENITAIQKFSNEVLEVWKDKAKIKALFAKDLDQAEFDFFIGLGIAMKANPFKREIWAVKYDKSRPASIFLGRDHYRKIAQEQEDYNGHTAQAVFEKDNFEWDVSTGLPIHKYKPGVERGRLLGSYGIAWKKGVHRPFYVYVPFEEATKGQSTWKSQPVTMIEKVAEARVLRMAWQGLFAGTYADGEQIIEPPDVISPEEKAKEIEAVKDDAKRKPTEAEIDSLLAKADKCLSGKELNNLIHDISKGKCASVDSIATMAGYRAIESAIDSILAQAEPAAPETKPLFQEK
jgi:phage recombination protein Bet